MFLMFLLLLLLLMEEWVVFIWIFRDKKVDSKQGANKQIESVQCSILSSKSIQSIIEYELL